MKEKLKKMSALLLAGILFLVAAGCGEGEDNKETGSNGAAGGQTEQMENAKGRYVEREVDLPESYAGGGSLYQTADGNLVLIDAKNAVINTSADQGMTWETEENEVLLGILNTGNTELTGEAVAPDGSLFFSYVPWGESTNERPYPEKYIYVTPDGTKTEFELGIDGYHSSAMKAVFAGNGRLFLNMNDGAVYEVDYQAQSASKIMESGSVGEGSLFSCGSTIAIVDDAKTYFLDMDTGAFDESDTVLNEFTAEEGRYPNILILYANDDKKVYAASRSGIYAHVRGGNVMEQLADGELINLGNPSKSPSDLLVLEDGTIFILYWDGELDSYTYDPEASIVPEHQLTIYSLYANDTIRQAVSVFRKENPDVYVKLEVGMTGTDGITENDAIKNLNTELLAGGGPDLILLDGMPLDSYIEKGILRDLSEVIDGLEGQYYENILKAYQKEEGLYAVPVRFALPILFGQTDTVSGIADLNSLADACEKQANLSTTLETVFGSYTAEETIEMLYMFCEGAWYKEDGSIDKEAVQEFFEQAKRIYEADQKNLKESALSEHQELVVLRSGYVSSRVYDNVITSGGSQVYGIVKGEQKISCGLYDNMSSLSSLFSVRKYMGNGSLKVYNAQMQQLFVPIGAAGISTNAKEPELAASFLKAALGTQVQEKDLGDGFPVNKDAFAAFTDNPYPDTFSCVGFEALDGSDVIIDVSWPSSEELSEIENLILNLKIPADLDFAVYDEVLSIGKTILTGEKELYDGVEEVCQKLTLHLAE